MQLIKATKKLGLLILLCSVVFVVQAQTNPKQGSTWPNQAIRIIVPFTPGGAPDILARVLAESWQQSLNVPVLVENRPGANGTIAADLLMKSAPDGYTLMVGSIGTFAINPALQPKLSYSPLRDFDLITVAVRNPNILIATPRLGVSKIGRAHV